MKNIILLFIVVMLGIIYINIGSIENTSFYYSNINITLDNDKVINTTIEDYIVGVVAAEMPASFEPEALKAQAITARTFLYYKIYNENNYTIETDKNFQAYITKEEMLDKWQDDYNKYYEKILTAVNETTNLVITYNNELIKSYYFSMSNGLTENVKSVFNEDYPYLQSVTSLENKTLNKYEVTENFTIKEILNKLNDNSNNIIINNIKYDDTNHVETIVVNDIEYTGTLFRKLLNLRSTDFSIEIKDEVTITTRGYGHDVGMSQYGANLMAKEGYNYKDIINHYYTNVKIININSIK